MNNDFPGTSRPPEAPDSTPPVIVALSSNERYFPGLYCTVVSLLLNLDPRRTASFFILDGGITKESKARLEDVARRIRPETLIEWLQIDEALFKDAQVRPGKSRMQYTRIALPNLLRQPKCLYLDCDILVFRDVSELFDLQLNQDCPFAAVPDCETVTLSDDGPAVAAGLGLPPDGAYFNSGVLLMDLEELRREDLLHSALDFLRTWRGQHRFHDQTAINFLFSGRIQTLASCWNWGAWQFDAQDDNKLDCLLHFTSAAPWLGGKPGPAQAVFETFAAEAGMSVERNSVEFRRNRRKWLIRNALSPVRLLGFPLLSFVHGMRGNREKAVAYRGAARYWLDYILDAPGRRRRYQARRSMIQQTRMVPNASLFQV
jgi:lipopolysaccharide biosynthesis glycosyltransferase